MSNSAIDFPWDKSNVTGTGTVHNGACVLHTITFNGMTTVGDCLVYDGVDAGGTLIATYNCRSAVHVSYQGMTFLYDCKMDTGIHMVFTNLVGNFTVTFK